MSASGTLTKILEPVCPVHQIIKNHICWYLDSLYSWREIVTDSSSNVKHVPKIGEINWSLKLPVSLLWWKRLINTNTDIYNVDQKIKKQIPQHKLFSASKHQQQHSNGKFWLFLSKWKRCEVFTKYRLFWAVSMGSIFQKGQHANSTQSQTARWSYINMEMINSGLTCGYFLTICLLFQPLKQFIYVRTILVSLSDGKQATD